MDDSEHRWVNGGQVDVVGIVGSHTFADADRIIAEAEIIVGDSRHLAVAASRFPQVGLPQAGLPRMEELRLPFSVGLDRIIELAGSGHRVCVLASGDPGFFGIVRSLTVRVPSHAFSVHPAPSSVSMAFARIGETWDDAVVVSVHGRSPQHAIHAAGRSSKVAVLTGPAFLPEQLAVEVINAGGCDRRVVVVSDIDENTESVADTTLFAMVGMHFSHRSVVLLLGAAQSTPTIAQISQKWGGLNETSVLRSFGRPVEQFAHRDAMITKPEVRAVVLSKLDLPEAGVLWDVGACSGSVGIEAAALVPSLTVLAIEKHATDIDRIRTNAAAHAVTIHMIHGEAPEAFLNLPSPDRVFVGGGGFSVVEASWKVLKPGGTLVATFAGLTRAAQAESLLGNMIQLSVSRAKPIGPPDGSHQEIRLAGEDPVFICWGTKQETSP